MGMGREKGVNKALGAVAPADSSYARAVKIG